MECEEQIRRSADMERSKLAAFGHKMDSVVEQIKAMKWYGQPPVGPFGQYVKVKDPQRWATVLRVIIGSHMSSFAITDPRDRSQLWNLLLRSGK